MTTEAAGLVVAIGLAAGREVLALLERRHRKRGELRTRAGDR